MCAGNTVRMNFLGGEGGAFINPIILKGLYFLVIEQFTQQLLQRINFWSWIFHKVLNKFVIYCFNSAIMTLTELEISLLNLPLNLKYFSVVALVAAKFPSIVNPDTIIVNP